MYVRQMTILLHASLDPYNTTEEMELTWSEVAMDWTNGKQWGFSEVKWLFLQITSVVLISDL